MKLNLRTARAIPHTHRASTPKDQSILKELLVDNTDTDDSRRRYL